jgi:hypothetical protein
MPAQLSFSRLFSILMVLALTAFSVACNKSDRDEDREVISAEENALAHHIYDDAFRQVHRFAMGDTLLNDTNVTQSLDDCLDRRTTVLSDTVAIFPLSLQLNWADDGIPCYDQELRYGIIRTVFTGKYLSKGSTYTLTFDGYRKDIYDVEGTVTITNLGLNSQGKRHYSFTIEDGHITGRNTDLTYSGTFVYVWASGSSTETDFTDDIFEVVEGFSSGKNTRGGTFTNEITAPYIADFSCAHFTAGRSYMEVENLVPRTINYGDDNLCDNVLISRRFNTYIEVEIPIMPLAAF